MSRQAYRVLKDDEFIRAYREIGPTALSKRINQSQRAIYMRRTSIQSRLGVLIEGPNKPQDPLFRNRKEHPGRIEIELKNGVCLIGSDCHYWPGPPSLMHRAFVKSCKELKPSVVILNGDVIDACTISRHPPIGWEKLPTVQEEIEAAQLRTGEICDAAPKARKPWPLGNHDGRFETRLATVAPEFAKVAGVHLSDHFPLFEPCWSVFINDDVVVKHRYKGGIHATRNNTLNSGRSIITGHLHSAKITPLTDYNGTRYGVDTGCIAEPNHRAFLDYTEDNAKDWRDGFCVLSFKDGRMLPPELVLRWDEDHVVFRGAIHHV